MSTFSVNETIDNLTKIMIVAIQQGEIERADKIHKKIDQLIHFSTNIV
jgi:hypothetical protein